MYVLYFVDVKNWKRRTAWAKGRGEYNSLACDYSRPHCSLLPERFGRDEAFPTKGSDERQLNSQANKDSLKITFKCGNSCGTLLHARGVEVVKYITNWPLLN